MTKGLGPNVNKDSRLLARAGSGIVHYYWNLLQNHHRWRKCVGSSVSTSLYCLVRDAIDTKSFFIMSHQDGSSRPVTGKHRYCLPLTLPRSRLALSRVVSLEWKGGREDSVCHVACVAWLFARWVRNSVLTHEPKFSVWNRLINVRWLCCSFMFVQLSLFVSYRRFVCWHS
jgi:hypothetical protein